MKTKAEWLAEIKPDNLSFFFGSIKKKESSWDSEYVNAMPFDSDILEGVSSEKQWDVLAEYAVEWLKVIKKLPTFAQAQDYERTGGCSYVGYDYFKGVSNEAGVKKTADNFEMTVNEGVFEKIIIPKEFKQRIIEAVTQLKEHDLIFNKWGFGEKIKKGKGVNLLFSGTSGTGKTYCGEVIAEYIGAPFELVSVASIESKWVGESEKNISMLFKSLDKGNKVLILDEVDSFLTSRSKHSGSSPHYNKLTNQFLVELERHNGICVMTTNRPVVLDRALQRRIDVVLDFPFPSEEARLAIWKHHIPEKAPLDKNMSFIELAKIPLNGGQIKNAVLDAARRAALGERVITMDLLLSAAKSEADEAKTLLKGQDHS